ncbi:MAG TPA: energy transducer TonB [Burkholderiaceae bacterium]|nr:energy transducer TonB [Burkholderiaceae bacterium]
MSALIATLHGAGPGRANRDFKPKSRFGAVGIAAMVGFHLVLGYALVSGLARQAIEVVKKPVDATLIEEVKLPPPPPPPKPIVKQEAPKVQAPPTAYVPPPDVAPVATTTAPVITSVQSAEPMAAPTATPPAPPAPAPSVASDIALACPRQIRPETPKKAVDDGIEGTVKAEAHIRGGKVVEVRILSGPRVYHAAVRSAMLRYECVSGAEAELVATQDFSFKIE